MSNELETLRAQNDTLNNCVNTLRVARAKMQQQRDELLTAAEALPRNPGIMTAGVWRDLDAAVKNCEPHRETIAVLKTAAEYAVSRLDAALERAHDSAGYDTAVAVRDAARSLSGGLAATGMEADALVAEMDALNAQGGPLDDVDDPAYAGLPSDIESAEYSPPEFPPGTGHPGNIVPQTCEAKRKAST